MESLNLTTYLDNLKEKPKANTWYDTVKMVSDRMHEPMGKWMKQFAGWDAKDIYKVYLSAEATTKQDGLPFGKALNWHMKEINK